MTHVIKIIKKLVLLCIIMSLNNCKSTKINNETQIIEAYVNQVLLTKPNSLTKRYYEQGVRLKEIEDKQWFIDYYSRNTMEAKGFYPKLTDSLFNALFNKNTIESYNKQLLNGNLDLSNIDHINTRIKVRPYSNDSKEKFKYIKYAVCDISQPLISLDNKYAIMYYTTSHQVYLILFKKALDKWEYCSRYNLIFP